MKNILIFLFLLLTSCGGWQEKSKVPPVIGEKEMIDIMIDLALSDAMVETEMLETNQLIYQKKLSFYNSIFEKHGYTEEEFESSYMIYSEDLPRLSLMYDSVWIKIDYKQVELKALDK